MRIALAVPLMSFAFACGRSPSTTSPPLADGGAASSSAHVALGSAGPGALEGELNVLAKRDQADQAPVTLVLWVKGDKVRMDLPERVGDKALPFGRGAYALFDSSAKKVFFVSDEQQRALAMDLTKNGEQLGGIVGVGAPSPSSGGAAPSARTSKATKTGHADTVAGYRCETWDVSSDHRDATLCMTEQEAPWLAFPATAASGARFAWMADLFDGKHLPLRLVTYERDGTTESARLEVTKIERRTVPAERFDYPSRYAVIDLAQMMHGLAARPRDLPAPKGPPKTAVP